jgi:hypothetical protein
MPRKKTQSPHLYRLFESAPLQATPLEVEESGTVRLGLVLEVLTEALLDFPEASKAVTELIETRIGVDPGIKVLP